MTSAMLLMLATVTDGSVDLAVIDRVDLIEINHFYDNGKHVLDQAIYYDWCAAEGRYHVRDWRPLKRTVQVPHMDWESGEYVARWYDNGMLREVRAAAIRETWTQFDPEFVERQHLPKTHRRLLARRLDPFELPLDEAPTLAPRRRVAREGNIPARR